MELKYGQTRIPFRFNRDARIFQIQEPEKTIDKTLFKQRLSQELERIKPDLEKPAIVIGDKTRLCGYPEYLPVLLECLVDFGAIKDKICIYIAYGTHLPQSEAECLNAYGPVYKDIQFVHHDCNISENFRKLGETTRGTEVYLRNDIAESTFLLTFGAVSHHYFAGYGGGRKLIFPGLGYKPAIYRNHGLFLDGKNNRLEQGCKAGFIAGNPLAEDLEEIESFRTADMAIHGILNSQGEVCDLLVGSGQEFFRQACRQYGQHCETTSTEQFDLVVASCGGFPKDINFIQSHKAVHNASAFVKDGGRLIVLAECRDGVGSKTFLPWLEMKDYQAAFERLSENYEGNGGTALAMMEKSKRIRISLVTTITSDLADTIGFDCISREQAQEAVEKATYSIGVIPNASLLVKRV